MQHLLMRWLLFLLPFSRSGAQHSERVSHLLKVLCREAEPGFHPRSLNPKRAVGLKRRNTAHEKSSPHRSPRDPGLERGHRGGGGGSLGLCSEGICEMAGHLVSTFRITEAKGPGQPNAGDRTWVLELDGPESKSHYQHEGPSASH